MKTIKYVTKKQELSNKNTGHSEKELEKLLEQGHIEKLNSCSKKKIMSPIVITMKKDGSIKLALDLKVLNKSIYNYKYQMLNINSLKQIISQKISSKAAPNVTYFTKIYLQYAYSQLYPPLPEIARHFNSNILSGNLTGKYRLKTGFYSLTNIQVEFEKAIETTVIRITNIYCFLDDIFIVSSATLDEHPDWVRKRVNKLDDENLRKSLSKCHFAKNEMQ